MSSLSAPQLGPQVRLALDSGTPHRLQHLSPPPLPPQQMLQCPEQPHHPMMLLCGACLPSLTHRRCLSKH